MFLYPRKVKGIQLKVRCFLLLTQHCTTCTDNNNVTAYIDTGTSYEVQRSLAKLISLNKLIITREGLSPP